MPHISTGWHYSMLLSLDADARQKIALLFVIAIKCFILWFKMTNSTDGKGFLSLAMTLKSPGKTETARLGWVGNLGTEMGRGGCRGKDVGYSDLSHSRPACCSVTQSCPTLYNLKDGSTSGFPVLHHLPHFSQTHVQWIVDAIQLSPPLSSPSPPVLNLSKHQGLPAWEELKGSLSRTIRGLDEV